MTPQRLDAHSQLFTVRLWREVLGAGETEWRGQVQHVLSGEMHYFRRWDELSAHLLAKAESGDALVTDPQPGPSRSAEPRAAILPGK